MNCSSYLLLRDLPPQTQLGVKQQPVVLDSLNRWGNNLGRAPGRIFSLLSISAKILGSNGEGLESFKMGQQTTAVGLSPLSASKCYRNAAIHVHIIYSCIDAISAELSSCDRDLIAHKA